MDVRFHGDRPWTKALGPLREETMDDVTTASRREAGSLRSMPCAASTCSGSSAATRSVRRPAGDHGRSLARFLAGQVEHNALGGFHVLRPDLPAVPVHHRGRFPVLAPQEGREGRKPERELYLHVVKRSLILILLGLIAGGVLAFRLHEHALDGRSPADRDLLSFGRAPGAQHQGQDPGRRVRRDPPSLLGGPGSHPVSQGTAPGS